MSAYDITTREGRIEEIREALAGVTGYDIAAIADEAYELTEEGWVARFVQTYTDEDGYTETVYDEDGWNALIARHVTL